MIFRKQSLLAAISLLLLTGSSTALSEDNYVPADLEKGAVKFQGWDRYLGSSFYGTMTDNKDVVGKDEGTSTTLGLRLEGALDFRRDANEWRNSLNLLTAWSRTPVPDDYLKSEDSLVVDSIYLFHLEDIPWAGPFVRANADTALFAGYDTRPEEVTYLITRKDGSLQSETDTRLQMTESLRPLKLKESVGFFVQPLSHPLASIELRTGVGFRQLYADGQYVLNDDSTTESIEVKEITDYRKSGLELGSIIEGRTPNKRVTYKLTGDILFPTYESPEPAGDERTDFDKRIVEVDGKVSFHLIEWASLDYLLKAVRDPDILDDTQISQSLMLSINQIITPRRAH